jgi:mycothiol synthase
VADEPRPYLDESDLDAMRRILIAGGRGYSAWAGGRGYSAWAGGREYSAWADGREYSAWADGPVFYVHVGDLNWWLFYSEPETAHHIYLWEADPRKELVAWALFSPRHTFDVFAHPTAVTPEERLTMLTWAEEHLSEELRASGGQRMDTIWISEHDTVAVAHLTARGFQCAEGDSISFMARHLDDLGPAAPLPPGFQIRPVAGEHEAEMRAGPQYSAFESSWDMARYVARYRRFMRSPVYNPEHDLMVIDPEGQAAAFCICWLDEVNRVGHFEPVGTHAAFQRQGLGKALLWEGLRLMQACGMRTATACPYRSSAAAMGVYQSAGFQPVHDLLHFYRVLT